MTIKIIKYLTYFSLALLFFAVTFTRISNFDFFWHLKAGEWMMLNKSFLYSDTFSYIKEGAPWFNFHSFFQISIAYVHKYFGMNALTFYKVMIFVIIYSLLLWNSKKSVISWILIFISLLCLSQRCMLRPEILTYLYLVIMISILLKPFHLMRTGLLILVQIFMVNSHSLFLLGPVLIFFKWLSMIFSKNITLKPEKHTYLIIFLLSLIVCLLSPYGWQGILFPFKLLPKILQEGNIFKNLIYEFHTPDLLTWNEIFHLIYIIFLVFFSVYCFLKKKLFKIFVILFFSVLFYRANRNFNLLLFCSLPLILEDSIGEKIEKILSKKMTRLLLVSIFFLSVSYSFLFISNQYYLRTNRLNRFGMGINPAVFSKKLPVFVNSLKPKPKIFNSMSLGGYLIYHLNNIKVFYDGRLDVYGIDHFKTYLNMIRYFDVFEKVSNEQGINLVILNHSIREAHPLMNISKHENWEPVYVDNIAIVFARKNTFEKIEPITIR